MDDDTPPAETEPSAEPPKPKPERSWKAGADTTTAIVKAILALLAIPVVVIAIIGIWRDVTARTLTVEVPDRKTLQAIGAEVDLEQALVDALNERIQGVRAIIAAQGIADAVHYMLAEPVSLQAAGLDITTLDLTRLIERALDR